MAARLRLSARDVSVQPGAQVAIDCAVTNVGRVVDEFHLRVLGDAARWAEVGPPLRLLPGQEGVARIVFSPPRAATVAAQAVVFGVQVVSTEDPESPAIEEALLNVEPFTDTAAELLPATSHGRRHGRHDLAVDNRGNQRLVADVSAADPADALRFRMRPSSFVVGPGSAAFARLVVSPRRRFWRGPARTHTFELAVRPHGGEPPTVVRGAMVQQQLLAAWVPLAALAALAGVALLAAAWLGLMRPAIQSAARQAVQQPLQAQAAAAKDARDAADAVRAQQQAQAAEIARITGSPPPTPTPTPGSPLGDPTDGRLTGNATFTVPDKSTLSITDLVIENPNDDSGMLRVQRDGQDLLLLKLDNFRDLDYHFVTPITLTATHKLQLVCQPATAGASCAGSIYYVGFMKSPPPAT